MGIDGIERDAMYKAMEILSSEQRQEFMKIYNEEYKRIYQEAIAEDAKKMMEELYGQRILR